MHMQLNTTARLNGKEETFCQTVLFQEDLEIEKEVVNLYPDVYYETFEGFGGAVTDSAAYVYSLMNKEQKEKLLDTYFSPTQMKYQLVRIHMDSCDFSVEQYEAVSDENDVELQSFSFERTEKYILPMLIDIREKVGSNLKLMLSPWSPPAFMKTNGKRTGGGSLRSEYRTLWAEYICRYIKEFQSNGFFVQRISIQNEPKAVQTWDSCVYTVSEEKEFLRDFLYPALQKHGLSEVEIFVWDHNKERIYERIRDILDNTTDSIVTGAAFHWYSGDHFEALNLVRQKYPGKKLILSESCLEYSEFDESSIQEQAVRLSHEIIGDLNHGMCAFYDWNILLDEKGGPNHVGNYCHAPFLYDRLQKKLMPQTTLNHFYHFSHFIVPGSVRIGHSRYTDRIEVVSYLTPADEIVVILLNRQKEAQKTVIRMENNCAEIMLLPESISTCVIFKGNDYHDL